MNLGPSRRECKAKFRINLSLRERERERERERLANHSLTPIKIVISSPDGAIESSDLMYSLTYA